MSRDAFRVSARGCGEFIAARVPSIARPSFFPPIARKRRQPAALKRRPPPAGPTRPVVSAVVWDVALGRLPVC